MTSQTFCAKLAKHVIDCKGVVFLLPDKKGFHLNAYVHMRMSLVYVVS